MSNKFLKGDKVKVTVGKDKGKVSTILSVDPLTCSVVLDGLNLITKHVKKSDKSEGGFIKIPSSIHWSNVSHLDSKDKITKISFIVDASGNKTRVCKTTRKELT